MHSSVSLLSLIATPRYPREAPPPASAGNSGDPTQTTRWAQAPKLAASLTSLPSLGASRLRHVGRRGFHLPCWDATDARAWCAGLRGKKSRFPGPHQWRGLARALSLDCLRVYPAQAADVRANEPQRMPASSCRIISCPHVLPVEAPDAMEQTSHLVNGRPIYQIPDPWTTGYIIM